MIQMFLGDENLDPREVEQVTESLIQNVRGVFDTTNNLMVVDLTNPTNRYTVMLKSDKTQTSGRVCYDKLGQVCNTVRADGIVNRSLTC